MTGLSLFDSIRKIFATGEGEDRSSLSRKVQESPQDPQARQKLGLFLLRQGEIVEGTDQLARAAILYEKSGFTTKAIAVLRQLLKNDPANIDFQRWLIRLFAQQGHTGDALSELQKAAAGGTHSASAGQKVNSLRGVAESTPDNPLPYLLIADLYLYERKLLEAISELEKAVPLVAPSGMGKESAGRMNVLSSLAGDNADLLEPCGFLWIAAGKHEDALPFLGKAGEGERSSGDSRRGANADLVRAGVEGGWGGAVPGAVA